MDEYDKALAKSVLKKEREKWHELYYDEIHNKPYLVGKLKESDESQHIYVMDPYKSFRFNYIKKLATDTGNSSILLNIHDSDSTSVYYRLQVGLPDLTDGELKEKYLRKSGDEMSDHESENNSDESVSESSEMMEESVREEEFVSEELNVVSSDPDSGKDSEEDASQEFSSDELNVKSSDQDSSKESEVATSPQIVTLSD